MFPAAAIVLWFVSVQGEKLYASGPSPSVSPVVERAAEGGKIDILPHLLLAMLAVLFASRLVGWAFGRLRQPPVMGEILAGIVLGPSVLGWLWPSAEAFIFPRVLVHTSMRSVSVLLLPAFFAITGLKTQIGRASCRERVCWIV